MKKFKTVVMNPPYNDDKKGGNLHLQVLENIVFSDNMDDSCEISSLQPCNFLLSRINYEVFMLTGAKRSQIAKFHHLLDYISEVKYYPAEKMHTLFDIEIINPCGIFRVNKSKRQKPFDLISFQKENSRWDETEIFDKVILATLSGKYMSFADAERETGKNPTPYFCILSKNHGHVGNKDFYDYCTPEYGAVHVRSEHSTKSETEDKIYFASEEESVNFHKTLCSDFYKYINWAYKQNLAQQKNRYVFLGNQKHPRTGELGYKTEWTDEDLFDFFDIPEEQRAKVRTIAERDFTRTRVQTKDEWLVASAAAAERKRLRELKKANKQR